MADTAAASLQCPRRARCRSSSPIAARAALGRACMFVALAGAAICLAAPAWAAGRSAVGDSDASQAEGSGLAGGFGAPGRVVSSRRASEFGAMPEPETTVVTFASGTRLIVRPTRNEPGQVSVTAWLGKGRAGVPEHLVHALWASVLVPVGGTDGHDFAELDQQQRQSGSSVTVTFVPGLSAFQWKGTVASTDLAAELGLLAAYARHPAFGAEMAEKIAHVGPMIAGEIAGSAASTFQRGVQHVLAGSTRYQELPDQADIAATTGADLAEMLRPTRRLAADVAIVGDISVADAIKATAATFASGGPRPRVGHVAAAATPPKPGTGLTVFSHGGDPAVAWLGEYWMLPDFEAAPRVTAVAQIAAAMIEARLVAAVPPSWPGASGPVVRAGGSPELKRGNAIGIALELHPEDIPVARRQMTAMVRAIGEGGFVAKEFAQARAMVAARHQTEEAGNAWWAERLVVGMRDPRLARAMRNARYRTEVSAAEVTAFCRRYLARSPIIVISRAGDAGAIPGTGVHP